MTTHHDDENQLVAGMDTAQTDIKRPGWQATAVYFLHDGNPALEERCDALDDLLADGTVEALLRAELDLKFHNFRPHDVEMTLAYVYRDLHKNWMGLGTPSNLHHWKKDPAKFRALALHQLKTRAKEQMGRRLRKYLFETLDETTMPEVEKVGHLRAVQSSVEEQVLGSELVWKVERILERMPSRNRQVFWLRVHEHPWHDIANAAGCPSADAARVLNAGTLEKLQAKLPRHYRPKGWSAKKSAA